MYMLLCVFYNYYEECNNKLDKIGKQFLISLYILHNLLLYFIHFYFLFSTFYFYMISIIVKAKYFVNISIKKILTLAKLININIFFLLHKNLRPNKK